MRYGAIVAVPMAILVAFANPLDAQPDQAKERAMAHLKAGIAHAEAHPPGWLEACEEFKAAKEEYPASWQHFGFGLR